jgi:RimJ/RimL family protein N-acetyltransferase
MNTNLFRGELVRLTAVEPKAMAEADARWSRNSEYSRLLDSGSARIFSLKMTEKWSEEHLESQSNRDIFFGIRTLSDDRLIGGIGLDGIDWSHGNSYVGIGIGDREDWGKGYGTDAMCILLRYAFTELNLHRVSLTVFEYNPRGIRSYQKAGFVEEGRTRGQLHREGRRWDIIYMGILKCEWEQGQKGEPG